MAWDMSMSLSPDPVLQDDMLRRSQLVTAGMCTDIDDARIILDMLGLVNDQARFPSWVNVPRRAARAPVGVPPVPLPSSGYGAVVPAPPD